MTNEEMEEFLKVHQALRDLTAVCTRQETALLDAHRKIRNLAMVCVKMTQRIDSQCDRKIRDLTTRRSA
ncbi:hypothetical protein LCGC14_1915260 [marine sediment metagenome]|uniref:Uncharacterized protein n=1 Tax=marine sediment metagenome TaxID=412755 RepID=A0A0F9FT42_9ZZZZ